MEELDNTPFATAPKSKEKPSRATQTQTQTLMLMLMLNRLLQSWLVALFLGLAPSPRPTLLGLATWLASYFLQFPAIF
jgi:hypothetical protein